MLASMSWKDFVEWQAYDKLEPIGGVRQDHLTASIVSALYNLRRNVEKYPEPFPLSTFLLKWGEDTPKGPIKPKPTPGKSWQELKMIGMICAAAFNTFEDDQAKKKAARDARRQAPIVLPETRRKR